VSGLVYLRARHYHPVLGRFFQRDSFGGFGHLVYRNQHPKQSLLLAGTV
jgi:RHS repeat-associated protein